MPIPILVGVTGHRDIPAADEAGLRESVRAELVRLISKCPDSETVMLNSLAAGGDIIAAEAARELSLPLICPLPLALEEYRRDFDEAWGARFDALIAYARSVFVAEAAEEKSDAPSRDFFYRQAGIYVASHSTLLIALWDGEEGWSGCGTAETVGFTLGHGDYMGAGLFNAENDGAVMHIMTRRAGALATPASKVGEARLIENEPGGLDEALSMNDSFNRGVKTLDMAKEQPVEKPRDCQGPKPLTFNPAPATDVHGKLRLPYERMKTVRFSYFSGFAARRSEAE